MRKCSVLNPASWLAARYRSNRFAAANKWALLLLCIALPVLAQPPLTPIADTLYNQDGSLYTGPVTVMLSIKSGTASGLPVLSTVKTLHIVNGTFSLSLVPNANLTPSGSTYLIDWGNGGQRTCTVPSSGTPITFAGASCSDNPPSNPQPAVPFTWLTTSAANGTYCDQVTNGVLGLTNVGCPGAGGGGGFPVNTVACSSSPTFDLSLGTIQQITLNCNVTSSSLLHLNAGAVVMFSICQDGVGGRTFTWPGAVSTGVTVGSGSSKCSSQWFYSVDGIRLISPGIGVINQ